MHPQEAGTARSGDGDALGGPATIDFVMHPLQRQSVPDVAPWHERPAAQGQPAITLYRAPEGYLIRFPHVADYLVHDDGRRVQCWPVFDADVSQAIYDQQVWPLALAQQGARVYHGGAVAVDGRAVVLLGPSGQGKSTLVAAFARRGYAFLSDDCLVVEPTPGGGLVVLPQAPCLRMWHDSAERLAGAPDDVHFHPGSPKPRVAASDRVPHWPLPLRVDSMYVLGDSHVGEPCITPLSPADAVIAWASNAFVLDLKDRARLSGNLRWAASMVSAIPASRLDYPRRYDVLDDVVDAILACVRREAAG